MRTAVTNTTALLGTAVLAVVTLAGCSTPSDNAGANSSSSSSTAPAGVDEEARALLPDAIKDKGVLTVASGLNYPPFEFKNPDGTIDGLDIDLINAIGERLGLEVNVQQAPFDAMLAGLASNRFDVAMAPFTITPERREQANFVEFISAATVVTVLKDSSTEITGTDTLCGEKTGVITGSIAQAQLPALDAACDEAGKPAIDAAVLPDQSAVVQALLSGQVDAMLNDSSTAEYVNDQTGDKLLVVGDLYEPAACGFAISKGNTELLEATQAAVQSLMDDGTYAEIFEKWEQTPNAVESPVIYTETEPSTEPSTDAAGDSDGD